MIVSPLALALALTLTLTLRASVRFEDLTLTLRVRSPLRVRARVRELTCRRGLGRGVSDRRHRESQRTRSACQSGSELVSELNDAMMTVIKSA